MKRIDSVKLIEMIKNKELELGSFIDVYFRDPLLGTLKRGTMRYNGVELLGLDEYDSDILTSNSYSFGIRSQEILDKVEKRYLRNIINPFRRQTASISKIRIENTKYECIIIETRYRKDGFSLATMLPYFKADTMYKNMELNKKYSLDKLEI